MECVVVLVTTVCVCSSMRKEVKNHTHIAIIFCSVVDVISLYHTHSLNFTVFTGKISQEQINPHQNDPTDKPHHPNKNYIY